MDRFMREISVAPKSTVVLGLKLDEAKADVLQASISSA